MSGKYILIWFPTSCHMWPNVGREWEWGTRDLWREFGREDERGHRR